MADRSDPLPEPSKITFLEKALSPAAPEFCLWEKPCCFSPLAAAGFGWRSISLGILSSLACVTSLTTIDHNKLFHIFSSCIRAIWEPVMFLALLQVPRCRQLCSPIPAICSPICRCFPQYLTLKILSKAFHVGGFPFSTFSSSLIVSSTQERISQGSDWDCPSL